MPGREGMPGTPLSLVTFLIRMMTISATALLLPLLLAPAVGAQVAADTARLDRVVITAARVPLSTRVAPGTITVLDGADLRARGVTTIAEALRAVPGVTVAQSGSYGGVTSLFTRGGNSNYTKVMVDGVPVNDPGGAINLANLTTDDVARIEIVRGPASVLYGSDAVSGVVHIITRRGGAGAGERAAATVRAGTFGTREISGEFAGGTTAAGYTVASAHRETDGIYPFNSRYRNDAVNAQLRVAPSPATDVTLSTRLWDARTGIATSYDGTVRDSTHYATERRAIAGLAIRQVLTDGVTAHLDGGTSLSRTIDDNAPTGPADTIAYHSHMVRRVARTVADARLDWSAQERVIVTVGGAGEWQGASSDGFLYPRGSALPVADDSRRSLGGYAQVIVRDGDRASLALSGRRDDNSRYGAFDTYRLAATVAPLPSLRLRLGTGTGFKEPSFYETFNTAYTTGNRDLRPERTTTAEGGIEVDLMGGATTLGTTYFRQRFADLTQYRFSINRSLPSYVNVGGARASGVEATVRSRLSAAARVGASYTFLETVVTDSGLAGSSGFDLGRPLVRRPKHSATADVGLDLTDVVTLGVDAQYVGARDDLDFRRFPTKRVVLGEYTLLNLSASYRLTSAPIALTLRATNILDRDYQSVFNFASPRRALLVGVRVGTAR
ncbi:MAG: TonB-dependent vitamin B12 receptor [Gemmatimonadaceae bacterium]